MLKINWNNLDKFYIVLPMVLVVLAGILIVTFRTIFFSYNASYIVDEAKLGEGLNINYKSLDEAYKWVFEKSD